MTHKHNSEPAFPCEWDYINSNRSAANGMTLRDYFAAKVIQGICASGPDRSWSNDMLACEAYSLADAMLKAREKSK